MIAAEPDPDSPFFQEIAKPGSLQSLVLLNSGGYMGATPEYNSRAAHAAEIGAAGGITNARGLAGMYAPLACGGTLKGVKLVDPDTLARMAAVASATGRDAVLVMPS